MRKTLVLVTMALSLIGISTFAQTSQEADKKDSTKTPIIEYGQTSELKGIKSYYVYSGLDVEARNNIVEQIKKRVPSLTVTEKPEQADVVLIYGEATSTVFKGWYNSAHGSATTYGNTTSANATGTSIPMNRRIVDGDGMVVTRTKEDHVRLLMKFNDTRKSKLERRPSTNFCASLCESV